MTQKRFSGQRTQSTPPTPAEIKAARQEFATCDRWLSELARGHPATKMWRRRRAEAEKVLARVDA